MNRIIYKKKPFVRSCICLCLQLLLVQCHHSKLTGKNHSNWESLFDGKTFHGWTKYLGVPDSSAMIPGMNRHTNGKYVSDLGINNDPLNVYTVVQEDGEPAIHVTGQVFGVLISDREYENYHLSMEFKWGEKKWPPRLDQPRDAGLLYHGFGEPGTVAKRWHPTQECQVQEGDTGDYWPIGNVTVEIPSVKNSEATYWQYQPSAPLHHFYFSNTMAERRCLKNPGNENAHGEWNTVEVIAMGDSSIHIVNEKVVMRLYHSRKMVDGKSLPLTKGKISLQSEGAELYYRHVQIKQIDAIPAPYAIAN